MPCLLPGQDLLIRCVQDLLRRDEFTSTTEGTTPELSMTQTLTEDRIIDWTDGERSNHIYELMYS